MDYNLFNQQNSNKRMLTRQNILDFFGNGFNKNDFQNFYQAGLLPAGKRKSIQSLELVWSIDSIPKMAQSFGFLTRPNISKNICVFTTKGGVLKSTLSFNLARIFALNNIRTCVVGLDMQADITTMLSQSKSDLEQNHLVKDINQLIDEQQSLGQFGLSDLFMQNVRLDELIVQTDIPTLHFIPETPELMGLCIELENNKNSFWFQQSLVDKLAKLYDVVIYDCSPNINRLTRNALKSCDMLLSPLECGIHNLRNLHLFRDFIDQFKDLNQVDFLHIYIPTKYSNTQKLSTEIRAWYQDNLENLLDLGIKDSVYGDEANKRNMSFLEYVPTHCLGIEMRKLCVQINAQMCSLDQLQLSQSNHHEYEHSCEEVSNL